MQLIAEVKTHSPFGWSTDLSWDELFKLADEFGDIVSIHTDPRRHGSFDLIKKARSLTDKPILAKGIHASDHDIIKALHYGADYVLVVGRVPGILLDKCFIEPNTLEELRGLDPSVKAVWNSRNLSNGTLKKENFQDARSIFPGWLCQASNLVTTKDVDTLADAVLVGAHLPDFIQSLKVR